MRLSGVKTFGSSYNIIFIEVSVVTNTYDEWYLKKDETRQILGESKNLSAASWSLGISSSQKKLVSESQILKF